MKKRVENIRAILKEGECALITSEPGRFYMTGFHSSAGTVVITPRKALFLIDFRYIEKARNVIKHFDVVLAEKLIEQLSNFFDKEKIDRIYCETGSLSVEEFKNFSKNFKVTVSKSDKLDKELVRLRSIKTPVEISYIKKAQEFTDKTFSYILERIKAGRSEKDVMLDMEFYMRKLGSEGVSFDFIVVSGKNSSLPHGVPSDKLIEKGDFITMDFGAVYNGYRSDMTRTVAVGYVSEKQKHVYDLVLKAQLDSIAAIKAGKVCSDIDKISRDVIYGAGFEGCYGHGLGHSVGIEIHESPNFNSKCHTKLIPGMIMTVEPGIYLENEFGVRIEDMVAVTKDGCNILTESPKDLIIL